MQSLIQSSASRDARNDRKGKILTTECTEKNHCLSQRRRERREQQNPLRVRINAKF